jgi:hypothetical protein
MSLHKEISFEDEVCDHLATHGWLHAEGDAAHYDRTLALFPADVAGLGAGSSTQGVGSIDQEPRCRQAMCCWRDYASR